MHSLTPLAFLPLSLAAMSTEKLLRLAGFRQGLELLFYCRVWIQACIFYKTTYSIITFFLINVDTKSNTTNKIPPPGPSRRTLGTNPL